MKISYENTMLPGYFFNSKGSDDKRATLILMNGFDRTQEELYHISLMAMKRGYNVLTFEGPGQGALFGNRN